jgi:hypothetical protein
VKVRQTRPGLVVAVVLLSGCVGCFGESHQVVREQRLPSGKVVRVVSCQLVWGVEHDERFPDRDSFALEYLATVPRVPSQDLEREVVEVFELIRPISEQWGFGHANVTALRSPDRTGTYDLFFFTRSASGAWSHTSQPITRNTESVASRLTS